MNSIAPIRLPEPEERGQDLYAVAEAFLTENPMRYVHKMDRYYIQKQDGEWMPVKPSSMKSAHSEWNTKFAQAVTAVLQDQGLCFNDVTYSFTPVPTDIMNLMNTEKWLKANIAPYHWIFDVLIQSLGGNKPANIEHLERVITYKYSYPATFTLPCMIIHGEGGVGKNLLVDSVLNIAFAGQTFSAKADFVVGQFNGLVKGKTVVLIDESENDRTDGSALKHLLHRERLTINDKGVPHYEVQNTPLYMISSNKSDGGIWLDRSEADRRYSVLYVRKGQTLEYWIARHEGWIPMDKETLTEFEPAYVRAKEWMNDEGIGFLTDKSHIANWIGCMFDRHSDKPVPIALHGEDFDRLMNVQKPLYERICEAVFLDESFTHINRKTLYQGFSIACKESGRKPMGDTKFYEKVREWIIQRKLAIAEHQSRQGSTGRPRGWCAVSSWNAKNKNNDLDYIEKDGYKDKWVGPEV